MKSIPPPVLTFLGAIVGGAIGYLIFIWLLKQGMYGLALPGAMVGVGAGMFRNRSIIVAIICGLAALGLGLFAEWQWFPWPDESFGYFMTHLFDLRPITLIMLAIGAAIGFWGPFRHYLSARKSDAQSLQL
jgi:hypothetical protein